MSSNPPATLPSEQFSDFLSPSSQPDSPNPAVKTTPPSWFQVTQHSKPSSTRIENRPKTHVFTLPTSYGAKGAVRESSLIHSPRTPFPAPVRNPSYDLLDQSHLFFLIKGANPLVQWSSSIPPLIEYRLWTGFVFNKW